MDVGVLIERTTETLDQRDRSRVGRLAGETRLFDQVRGKAAVNDAEHLAHDRRPSGEQETQRIVFLP